nr:reverse transcriptase domain-containing protein [Tanacetum cinerariifolium]
MRRIQNIVEPEFRAIKNIVTMADRTMEELLQAPTEGYEEAIVIPEILAEILKSKRIYFSGNLLNKTTREVLKIIENKSKVRYSRNKSNVARVNTNFKDNVSKTDDRVDKLADQISNLVEIVNKQVIAPAKVVEKICVTCGGAHAYYECITTDSNPSSICAASGSYNQISPPNRASYQISPPCKQEEKLRRNLNDDMRSILGSFFQYQPSTSGTLLSNTIPNPMDEMKAVTTCSGLAYEGPSIPIESPLEKVDEQNTKEILDKEQSNNSGSTAHVQPPVVPILMLELDIPKTQATILYPSRTDPTRMTLELADRSITIPKESLRMYLSSPTLVSDDLIFENDARKVPIIKSSSPTLTPFGESDFFLKEIKDFLNDDSIPVGIENSAIAWKIFDIKGIDLRFCTHKILMEDDYKPAIQSQRRVNPKIYDVIKKEVIKLLDAGMIYPISDSPWDFSKIARLMTHLLEKETPFVFSKECINAFNTLKKKLTEAPILVVPDWNLPIELMCDASDYAIGAVLGQRKSKYFQPIHYASKNMTEAQIWSDVRLQVDHDTEMAYDLLRLIRKQIMEGYTP